MSKKKNGKSVVVALSAPVIEGAKEVKLPKDIEGSAMDVATVTIDAADLEKKEKQVKALKAKIAKLEKEAIKNAKADEVDETKEAYDRLKTAAESIISKATNINEAVEGLKTDEEVSTFLGALDAEFPGMEDAITSAFPDMRTMKSRAVGVGALNVATNLPASDIITNLPMVLVEQVVQNITITFPLMHLVDKQMVRNGIKDFFYKDDKPVGTESGFSDVVIGDFNNGGHKQFKETYRAKDEISASYDILDTVLNDVTVTPGLFVAIINDFIYAIARPLARKMYERFITFLDDTANHDHAIDFVGADAKAKAKEVNAFVSGLATPSRLHLGKKPNGSAVVLEFMTKASELVLVVDSNYAADYDFDIAANTFQINKITIQFKEIIVLDFKKVADYIGTGAKAFGVKMQLLIMNPGVYFELVHYEATKTMNTPKLKTVYKHYTRVGNGRVKNKLLVSFNNK